jgi:hypothetical protein
MTISLFHWAGQSTGKKLCSAFVRKRQKGRGTFRGRAFITLELIVVGHFILTNGRIGIWETRLQYVQRRSGSKDAKKSKKKDKKTKK